MGCRSDYMEPSNKEREMQRAAGLLLYVWKSLGKPSQKWAEREAENAHASDERCVTELCAELKLMNQDQLGSIIYDARNKKARDLANWWEEHQAADKAREASEAKEANDKVLRDQAVSKLSVEERTVLGLKS